MTDWPRYHVAGDRGSDGATGLDPDSPLRTLTGAIRKARAWGGAAEILLRDCLISERVVIDVGGLTIRGLGAAWGGGSSKIQARGISSHCIVLAAPDCRIHSLTTVGPEGRWTGVGYRLQDGCQNAHLTDCWHIGHPKTVCDKSSGGTALYSTDNEGARIDNLRFARCRRGVRQGTESSGLTLVNTRGSNASCEALLIDGKPTGGIRIRDWKTTHCGKANGIVADLGSAGQGIYEGFDLDEASWPTKVLVKSHANTFIGSCSAPNTSFDVTGNLNSFDGFKINGESMHVTGQKNRLDRMQIAGTLIVAGKDNKVGLCDNDDSHKLVMGPGNERF